MNSLRFGSLERARNRYLLDHVVEGIADYGNCLGIPTVGGEVVIEDSYSGNCLVNAMALGIVDTNHVASAVAMGVGNPVFIVGSKTGRDGIHGATFASVELTEETESKRSNVQVGDPFTEKLLMEASLELSKKTWLVGMQDMGAAGITCSCSEMSAKGESGIKIYLDKVPLREEGMNAYEIMLSESQERMLVVTEKGFEQELQNIFEKWDLNCTLVGEVTNTGMLEVFQGNKIIAEIPSKELVLGGGAPQYDMPVREPAYFRELNNFNIESIPVTKDFNKSLLILLSSPNITSKQFVFRQYDSTVRSNTVQGPGGDAAVIRLKGTRKGLSISTDCNGRYVYLNPRMGAQIAVAESARNVVCSGAEPIAITNCLNFGNPQDPEIYWQFKEAVLGIGEACRALNTPVTGGNVSFYNETSETAVYPTPVIGMVGLLENIGQNTTLEFKDTGDFIVTLGALNGSLGGSEYLKTIQGQVKGPIPHLNLELEMGIQELCLDAIKKGIIKSAHDLSAGGLAVNVSESIVHSNSGLGAKLDVVRKLRDDELVFGECQSVIVVTLEESALYELILLSQKLDVHTQTIGRVTDTGNLVINDLIDVPRIKLEKAFFNSLAKIMTK
jgi:phosphoribosylformylglycinamidine synthase